MKMIDPVNPLDKVVVVVMIVEKEDMLVYIIARDVHTFVNHFQNLISLYQPELAQ